MRIARFISGACFAGALLTASWAVGGAVAQVPSPIASVLPSMPPGGSPTPSPTPTAAPSTPSPYPTFSPFVLADVTSNADVLPRTGAENAAAAAVGLALAAAGLAIRRGVRSS